MHLQNNSRKNDAPVRCIQGLLWQDQQMLSECMASGSVTAHCRMGVEVDSDCGGL
jgi:hypothetical protein